MITRRQFMCRGALAAAGGIAVPMWARWLGEQMDKLQPKKHVVYRAVWQPLPPGNYKGYITSVTFKDGLTLKVSIRDWEERNIYGEALAPMDYFVRGLG